MADLPFGFSPGDDPQKDESGRDKRGKNDPESGSGASDPLGAFGMSGDFNIGDLGQIFTQLGQMFSSAGTMTQGGETAGPVNYELARRVATSSIGFVAPIPATTNSAIAYAPLTSEEPSPIEVLPIPQLVNPGEVAAMSLLPSFLYIAGDFDFAADTLTLPWHDAGAPA